MILECSSYPGIFFIDRLGLFIFNALYLPESRVEVWATHFLLQGSSNLFAWVMHTKTLKNDVHPPRLMTHFKLASTIFIYKLTWL